MDYWIGPHCRHPAVGDCHSPYGLVAVREVVAAVVAADLSAVADGVVAGAWVVRYDAVAADVGVDCDAVAVFAVAGA